MIVINKSFLTVFSLFLLVINFTFTHGARFYVTNRCPYTVWAAAVPGGGQQLNPGQMWSLDVAAGTTAARIWGRTNCKFDGSGRGRCQTGDCGGLLRCQAYGTPPNTLAEFALNQYMNLDFFDISLIDGFNVPMEFSPTSNRCRGIRFFKDKCPDAYSYPKDDATSTFTCPGGTTNYKVVFCP
ncbi:thaumatin-like protein [Neltuma alba]|uniref:thaumatin-like protein n=1 Tax=Neltuma alba TaxID=207710 RepID=UPI0010A42149|nr:thaumatin-like protein [Prosopis alba]